MRTAVLAAIFSVWMSSAVVAKAWELDESPAGDGEWGYRPADATVSETSPPSFSWRPQSRVTRWELQCARDVAFDAIEHQTTGIEFNVYCPPCELPAGTYWWRYRGMDENGNQTNWNRSRTFAVPDRAVAMPMPGRDELLARIPTSHPRLFIRPEQLPPRGATGYRYNDEAGMPYAYHFSRTYTFVHDLLTPQERDVCCQVMKVRGEEMYRHLCPGHMWRPYSSHSNRAWHFLGEVGVAFQGEIEGADDWVWFAMNVFFNTYPVWSDDDGGWHEGVSYWSSYIGRFTWWADVMRAAFGINAFQKPYFSKV